MKKFPVKEFPIRGATLTKKQRQKAVRTITMRGFDDATINGAYYFLGATYMTPPEASIMDTAIRPRPERIRIRQVFVCYGNHYWVVYDNQGSAVAYHRLQDAYDRAMVMYRAAYNNARSWRAT